MVRGLLEFDLAQISLPDHTREPSNTSPTTGPPALRGLTTSLALRLRRVRLRVWLRLLRPRKRVMRHERALR